MASDTGCERIHKEKKRQRAKFYSLSQGEKGHGVERYIQQQNVGALSFYYGIGVVVEQDVSVGFVQAASCSDVIFGCRFGLCSLAHPVL